MSAVTLTFVGDGLEELLARGFNDATQDTMKLHAYSAITNNGDATALVDITESANTTAQDIAPASLSTSFSSPTATLTYSGDITIPVSGGSATKEGYYITNQAGTTLIAFGAATSETVADGGNFTVSSFAVTLT